MYNFSDTFQQVHQESLLVWSHLQANFLEEYKIKAIFPIHLQALAFLLCFVRFIIWCTYPDSCSRIKKRWFTKDQDIEHRNKEVDKLNDTPTFVRGKQILKYADCFNIL